MIALRFVAGETLEEALKVVADINSKGMHATLDFLGEDTTRLEEADQSKAMICNTIEKIDQLGLRANVSIKLSQLGLAINEKECANNLADILRLAVKLDTFVRIDMEDSSTVEATFRIYTEMFDKHGFHNVGLVIQSYLYRSEDDIVELLKINTRIRLVKGAYREPSNIAYPKKSDVDKGFDKLTKMLLDASKSSVDISSKDDGRFPPITAIASHDERRVEFAKQYSKEIGLQKNDLEFQMLYGIRRNLQTALANEGYPVRIYVPFGVQWFPYFTRRLAERPANLWFFLTSLFRK
ncbi:MAG: proline dehydrogenase family protein [Chloroflexi bacterium]|nr:proline dehydrogenase family protein [Chloroflexota bacterium]